MPPPDLPTLLEEREKRIASLFPPSFSKEDTYKKIIELSKLLPPMSPSLFREENRVTGCQSVMYLWARTDSSSHIHFLMDSKALISKGLAALMWILYNDTPPEFLLLHPPTCLERLGLYDSLSLSRSNGLRSLHLHMQQKALSFLSHTPNPTS